MIHMMKFSRLKAYNTVRELSRFISEPSKKHLEVMYHTMYSSVGTPERGLILRSNGK